MIGGETYPVLVPLQCKNGDRPNFVHLGIFGTLFDLYLKKEIKKCPKNGDLGCSENVGVTRPTPPTLFFFWPLSLVDFGRASRIGLLARYPKRKIRVRFKIMIDTSGLDRRIELLESVATNSAAELLDELRDINWTTRTGRAEQGLNAFPFKDGDTIGIVFGGAVYYQVFLESWKPHIIPTGESFSERFKQTLIDALR